LLSQSNYTSLWQYCLGKLRRVLIKTPRHSTLSDTAVGGRNPIVEPIVFGACRFPTKTQHK
jgi:hypothetical protein